MPVLQPPVVDPFALTELLTGPSSTFQGTIGGWAGAGSGTTVTYESGAAYSPAPGRGALKLHTTASDGTAKATLALAGTFLSGRVYQVEVVVKHSVLTTNNEAKYEIQFGKSGTDAVVLPDFLFAGPTTVQADAIDSDKLARVLATWSPSADRTGVDIRLIRLSGSTGTFDLYVESCRVVLVPAESAGLNFPVKFADSATGLHESPVLADTLSGTAYPRHGGGGPKSHWLGSGAVDFRGPEDFNSDYTLLDLSALYGLYMYGVQSSAGRRISGGITVEAGPNFTGFVVGERASTELEFYPDGDNDVYLLDGFTNSDVKHWWHEEADGTYKASAGRKSRIGLYFQQAFHVTGVQTTGTAKNEPAEYWQMPFPAEVDEVRIHVGTAPTGAAFIVDVNINGTTIFTSQGNRPSIAISGTDATSGSPDTTKFAKDDRLSFDIDQVGSTIAGSDLTVMVRGRYLW
jgi:hypothetical protein